MNTINSYIELILPELGIEKRWYERTSTFEHRQEAVIKKIQKAFNNVAQSYHRVAINNFLIIAEGKFLDTHGKKTKKINYATLLKISELIKFKP